MSLRLAKLRRLARDAKGIALIEFALSLPIIMALTFGAIVVARLVINRLTLQQASAEVASLIIVRPPEDDGDNSSQNEFVYIKNAAMTASGLPASAITVSMSLTCNGTTQASTVSACPSGQEQGRLVRLVLSGSYTPSWSAFGIGGTINQTVTRVVRIQ